MGKYSRLQELYAEKQQIQQELENTEYFYEKIQQGQDTIRNIRHDMKNRLSGILAAMQNEGENRQQIEAELQTALGLISSVKEERYCNNNYINSILSYKLQNIASDQIDVSVRMLYPEKLNIDYGDMGVLLGNLIDNAVEACEYVKTEKPYIHIKGYENALKWYLEIENSRSLHQPLKNSINHGRGIRNVEQVLQKYHAELRIKKSETKYKTEIVFMIGMPRE